MNPDSGPCGHGVADDGPEAAEKALNAGTDSEMVSTNYRDFGTQLVASGAVSMKRIDDAVRRILRIKFRAGLFDHPYDNVADRQTSSCCRPTAPPRAAAAGRSMVLLKNDGTALPFDAAKKTARRSARCGQRAPARHARPVVGPRRDQDAVSLFDGIKAAVPEHDVHAGLHAEPQRARRPGRECATIDTASRAVAAAQAADQVVLALGETREMSGEAEARSNIDLPGRQQDIIDAVKATGKPFAVVLFNGRPLTLTQVDAASPAILEAWFGGIEAGNARRRRALRQGQPRRQAAGELPAQRRPGADLLQPRADRPPVRPDVRATTRATATSSAARRCTSSASA